MRFSRLGSWICCGLLIAVTITGSSSAQTVRALQVDINHVIHPLTAEIVTEALSQAQTKKAVIVVIRLDTPGGLLDATQKIVQAILHSPIPVVTYVGPSGGRAASAGFMILMAGDVASMAPGTNTGAAHPVLMGGGKMDEVMNQKVENDTAAAVRAVTAKRGRNSKLAQQAVIESRAFTDREALESNLVDIVADNVPALLKLLDGRTIQRFNKEEQILKLANATIIPYEMTRRQKVLLPLIDPKLAFIMLAIGILGVYVEFTHPGLIAPGVLGAILVILGLMSLTMLPINWAGAALLVLGFACFALEATMTTGGILAVGGTISMVLGAVLLVNTDVPELSIDWGTAIAVTLPFSLISIFLLRLTIQSFRLKTATGIESMVGEIGLTKTDINPDGQVFCRGQWWTAYSGDSIPEGKEVKITRVHGLRLTVEPTDKTDRSNDANDSPRETV
ncbi:MAG: serine protease [Solibacterales bacterium]|nr:serine protease [Bryobacterales bacterium]|tara:strand:- start:1942 stop:3288 length:1347 start_codon:yes stop_codon:yes gene_type:complete